MEIQHHLLVVDDDRELRTLVGDYLTQNGYRVSLAVDGKHMYSVLEQSPIDLLILDVMLPGEDGLSLCRKLRSQSTLPILMLTARSETLDRIVGLEIGADDYLPKPFEPRELLARTRSILRRAQALPPRPNPEAHPRYRFSGWILDTRAHQLTSPQGVEVTLSTSEYRLLKVLLTHALRVLSRDQLMELIKGREQEAFDRSIDLSVSRLRQKLRDDARAPQLIKTLRNEGYVLMADVETEGE